MDVYSALNTSSIGHLSAKYLIARHFQLPEPTPLLPPGQGSPPSVITMEHGEPRRAVKTRFALRS